MTDRANSQEKKEEELKPKPDLRAVKIGVVALAAVVLAGLFGFELGDFKGLSDLGGIITLAIVAALWLVFLIFSWLMIDLKSLALALSLIQAGVVWYFNPDQLSDASLIAGVILFVFLAGSYFKIRQEMASHLRLRFFKTSSRGAGLALTGVAIFITALFIGTLNPPGLNISKSAFEFFLTGTDSAFELVLPGTTLRSTVRETFISIARSQAPLGSSQALVNQAADELMRQMSSDLGFELKPNETVLTALYGFTLSKLREFSDSSRLAIAAGLAILMFSLVKFLTIFVNWAIMILGWIIYELLIGSGFLKIKYEEASKEILTVS